MAEAITVARPYAQAAFERARELGDLKGWSEKLQAAADAVMNADVRTIITSPGAVKGQIADLMLALIGSTVNDNQGNFLRLLVEGNLRKLP